MNQQDLNAMTEFWHRETNHLNDSIDSAFKSAQDDAYARGYRRGREDLIDIRKQRDVAAAKCDEYFTQAKEFEIQRDELLTALKETRRELDACQKVIWLASDYGFDPAYVNGAKAAIEAADIAIARVKGQQ